MATAKVRMTVNKKAKQLQRKPMATAKGQTTVNKKQKVTKNKNNKGKPRAIDYEQKAKNKITLRIEIRTRVARVTEL